MGAKVKWRVRFRLGDGAFHESITSSLLSYSWGYEGVSSGKMCWEMDSSGVTRRLALDDHESLLLSAWARTGIYALAQVSDQLESVRIRDHPDEGEYEIKIKIKGGKVHTRVELCRATGHVIRIHQRVVGSTEAWHLSSYQPVDLLSLNGLLLSTEMRHEGSSSSVYRLKEVEHIEGPQSVSYSYAMPTSPILPRDTSFDLKAYASKVSIWLGPSRHILVRPKLKLSDSTILNGLWIVDSGASGFVISSTANRGSTKSSFGELKASGISGQASASLIQAVTFELGGLTIRDPLVLVIDLSGIIKGIKVEGIIGYDLFRRCIIEVNFVKDVVLRGSQVLGTQSVTKSRSYLILKSPEEPGIEAAGVSLQQVWSWTDITLIACLPHVWARFKDASGRDHTLLLLLDTGASGAGLFIHHRAVEEEGIDLSFPSTGNSLAMHQMKGVGGVSGVVDVVEIPCVTIAGQGVNRVKCVVTSSGSGIDLSLYSHGIIGSDFLHGLSYCIDLTRNRLGILYSRC